MCICNQKHFKMPRKPKKKFFNSHLRKKRFSQENEVEPPDHDSEPSISEPIASRRHARIAKLRCIKSLSRIIKDERRFGLREASESEEQRSQRLHDLRRRPRIARARRRQEQKRRIALRCTYLPTYKCRDRPAAPRDVAERLNYCNIVGQQQQSELTKRTHDDDTGSQKRNSHLQDDDDYTEQFDMDIKVEPNLDVQWDVGDSDRQTADGKLVDKSKAAKADTDDIEIKEEEPLAEKFNNIVLERTVLIMYRDN